MPRQTQHSVTRGEQSTPYTTNPSVQSQVVARPVGDRTTGLRMLSQSLAGFFGDVQGAFKTVQDAEFMKEKVKIEQENQQQQWEAHKLGVMGGELSPEQQGDLDYTTPYNQAKAGRAAMEDAMDFEKNVLPNIGIADDPFDALNKYMGTKLEGIQNKQYGAFYADAMLRGTSEAIGKQQANAITAKKYEVQEDWKAQAGMQLKAGLITSPQQLMALASQGGMLNNPANPVDGERWAVTKMLEIARTADADGTLMTSLVEMLQQPVDPTPDNPEGLSFATRWPDGFNDIVKNADKNDSYAFQEMEKEYGFKIDTKIAEGDIAGAFIELNHARGQIGSDEMFREQELKLTAMIADGADERAAVDSLLYINPADTLGSAPDPALVDKYGDKALKLAMEQGGPVMAVKYMTHWNTIPTEFRKEIERNLTKTTSPEAMAEYYSKVVQPMMDSMPATLMASLDDDSEWVMRYIHDEQMLRNVDPLTAAREAATTLDEIKKQGLSVNDVRLWGPEPGARDEFMDNLKTELGNKFGDVGIIDKVNPWGNAPVQIPDHLMTNVFIPAIQRRALKYQAAGVSDAVGKATQEIMEGAGARVLYLPNAEGNTYLAQDVTPDTAAKWQKRTLATGEVYDPVEEFRKTSSRPDLGWISGGEPLELRPGRNSAADGGMVVHRADGMGVTFGVGQEIDWSTFEQPSVAKDAQGNPMGYLDMTTGGKKNHTLVLPDDEVAAENMLTEMLGETNFRLAKIGEGAWQLEYVETGKKAVDIEAEARKKDLENLIKQEDSTLPSIGEQLSQQMGPAFNNAMAQPQGGIADLIPKYDGYTELFGGFIKIGTRKQDALEDQARQIATKLQDAGMLPTSTGSTMPFPKFENAKQVVEFLRAEMGRKQSGNGGMPMENVNANVDNKYTTIRYKSLKAYEGVRSKVYKDTRGIATVGIGLNLEMDYNTDYLASLGVDIKKLKAGEVELTEEQIQLSFENAVRVAEDVVTKKIKVPLNSYQRSALVSMAYNGPKLLSDDLVDAVNSGKFRTAAAIIAKKKINKTRRQKEAKDFLKGVPKRLQV